MLSGGWARDVRAVNPADFPLCRRCSLPLRCVSERDAVIASRQSRLVECLMFLVSSINEKRDHIPPLKSNSPAALAFSFELSFTFGDKADESWGLNTIKRMLKQGPPMLLS